MKGDLFLSMPSAKFVVNFSYETQVEKTEQLYVELFQANWSTNMRMPKCTRYAAGCGKHAAEPAVASWMPPQNPNPKSILNEAQSDARSGQYASALAKYVWFYKNALKYAPAMRGVRLSFALGYWADLGASYPPALEQLKGARDEAAESAFGDFVAINAVLKNDSSTAGLFTWLDANKPAIAKSVFDRDQYWLLLALVKTKNYSLCGRYIDPDASFEQALQLHRTMMEGMVQYHLNGAVKDFSNRELINKSMTLVAVLVIDGRKPDAQRIADKISKEPDLPEFKADIQKALNGEVPAQFP
jgi:hypothetical protein